MNGSMLHILILAGIAIFLVLKLRAALGTRDGFEKPPLQEVAPKRPELRAVETGPDPDIIDHAPEGSDTARALAAMKRIEPGFSANEFLGGARGAYEMILMGFEKGEIAPLKPYLSDPVYASFDHVVAEREARGEIVEAEFVGISGLELRSARFDEQSREAELTVQFRAELVSAVYDAAGTLLSGDPNSITKQQDVWTFARQMGSNDPNWQLVATGE